MLFLRRINRVFLQCQGNLCSISASRMCSSSADLENIDEKFLMKLLGMSRKDVLMLKKGTSFKYMMQEDVQQSFDTLQEWGFTRDIKQYPGILGTSAATLKNRHQILEECSFCQITAAILHKYVVIMNKPINLVKSYGYIPETEKIAMNLAEIAQLHEVPRGVAKLHEDASLNDIRKYFVDAFLRREIGATEEDLKRIWHSYVRLRNIPINSVVEVIELVRREMNFSNEKILKHAYLLHGHPENMQKILSLSTLAGRDVKEVLSLHPKIFMSNYKSIVQITDILQKNGIPDTAINNHWLMYTLSPQTVKSRLDYLMQIGEFRVLLSHPRICRLIYYQNKALHRLNYLKENKIFCASLNVLSGDTESFQRYVQNGIDATKGKEMVYMLGKKLKRSLKDIRERLSRHPNWCHVPVVSMSEVYDYLTERKFTSNDIFSNIHILFYPLQEIIKKFEAVEKGTLDYVKDIDCKSLNKSQMLALVLYAIEIEFNFSGDGIWGINYVQSETTVQEKNEEIQANI